MPRKLRLEFSGACYHVLNRGNYRRNLFATDGAAESFERCLFEAVGRFGWRLHAFVIMRNHFHLALETPEPNLSAGMRWLQATWAARFNRRHGETGRPFQGRYKALHVEPGHALAQVAHYIHLNPVRAKVVPAERLLEFRWSSLPRFAARVRPAGLSGETVLAQSGELADTPAGWRSYLAYLGVLAEEDGRRREEKFGRLSRGWAVGSGDFRAKLRTELLAQSEGAARFGLLGADRDAHQQVRTELWEEKLQAAAKALQIDLAHLGPKKSAADKVALAAVLKTVTGVTNRWLADRLAMGAPASVSQFVRRFQRRDSHKSAVFKRALSIVKP
jgi:REP element-mobilizing transposase RayT